ncbi:MAG TPA: UvrD-helicase domain-containing protein [Pyrinomonadaceae bacterium]|nr:UvrD-helicase domain-containing protein [Pyrinomonadaceae bacterium]
MREKRQLQPEQAAAAYEISRHISVTAGPGSGKTTVLVERYLHILRTQKLSIDQVVAITFTNRAANEMRERLRQELDQILASTKGDERKQWLNYKRTLDGAIITTIHGFCARLLREFPVEVRIDPQFLLLDEHRAAMLLESVVEEVLSEFISAGHEEVSRLTLGVGRGKLANALAQLYRDVRGQGLSFDQLSETTAASHVNETEHSKVLIELDSAMAEFRALRITTPKAHEKHAAAITNWPSFRSFIQTIPEAEALADYCNRVEAFRTYRLDARGALKDHVRRLDDLVWGTDLIGKVPQVCFDMFASRYALEMTNLLRRIHDRLNEEKQKLAALDFDDLESRTLELLEIPEVLTRAAERYKFFLVDEFQDTNGMQRRLLERLVLATGRSRANLFIVGDRKQSIYGFRGADVDVFREMTDELEKAGGEQKSLQLNFRSQPTLINFFNYLFARVFQVPEDVAPDLLKSLGELGYVDHESSQPKRETQDTGPLVELMVATKTPGEKDLREQESRERDAQQLVNRIKSLMQTNEGLLYSDIALLFRAMTFVSVYETAFRRANIPYQTILGRGFYEREEITDLVQLLRFLDNKTDELALAAVLRSPLCGISDNALLALRCAPRLEDAESEDPLRALSANRPLFFALQKHHEIAFIGDEEHRLLDRAAHLIGRLIARRHHYSIDDLLRFAVDESEYAAVIAANFDGAQRLANVQRLFTLAARFERSGHHLIRDFVRYVEEFEAIGSRESEGQIDEAANAVRLMTIHQAKGLEFPVVIIPELHRPSRLNNENAWVLLDRHRGLTLKVPDGRGRQVAGCTFSKFEARHALREQFESMRLLYVAATRAEDRLILSGATDELANLSGGKSDSWLKLIWQKLELQDRSRSDIVNLADEVSFQLTVSTGEPAVQTTPIESSIEDARASGESLSEAFPLLRPVPQDTEHAVHRFSVTQLINYQRCPRQYYFDRVLRLPSSDEMSVWNNAEAPEPPANLTATLKGAVIHRFCERYSSDQRVEECLRGSFAEVVRLRQAEFADRLIEIDPEAAVKDLLPLAQNYLDSDVFRRVEAARSDATDHGLSKPVDGAGLWSELSFRLRRPTGILSGAIDKLLITRNNDGTWEVEIIDFKTNRISISERSVLRSVEKMSAPPAESVGPSAAVVVAMEVPGAAQFAFDFESSVAAQAVVAAAEDATLTALVKAAHDYQLQMQSYALAVRELLPSLANARVRVTLHFLEPNVEFQLGDELLEPAACEQVIDEAMLQILSSSEPAQFPVVPAPHCRMCNFLRVCTAGRAWLKEK